MELDNLINIYKKKFKAIGIKNPLSEIRFLLAETAKLPLSFQIMNKNFILNKTKEIFIKKSLDRRLKKEPLDRIINKKVFRDFEISLSPDTFSPRHETELLIDIIINLNLKPNNILELGTGSGAVIIALAKTFLSASCIASDINHNSLKLAKKNAQNNRVADQINFICCNWLDIFVNSDFDLIIANPPYIRTEVIETLEPEVKFYDPIIALDGGKTGLDCYKEIILGLKNKLKDKTVVVFEIGFDQALNVTQLMKEANIMYTKTFYDYANHPRFIVGTNNKNIL